MGIIRIMTTLHELLGLDAIIFLETGGEILRILESHHVGKITDAQVRVFLCQPVCLFHTDVSDEGGDVHPGDGTFKKDNKQQGELIELAPMSAAKASRS